MIDSPVVSVHIPPPWRELVGGHAEVTASGDSVREILEAVAHEYPAMRARLFAEDGGLKTGFVAFLGPHSIRELSGIDTPIGLEEVLTLILIRE